MRVQYRDAAGNVATMTDTILLDTTAPVTVLSSVPTTNGKYTNPLILAATDNAGGSGIATTYYSLDGGAQILYPVGGIVISKGMHQSLEFWSIDMAGNVEMPHETLSNFGMN